ncbi:MAG: SIS domain-containing protein [Pseudomonadota bacterium]
MFDFDTKMRAEIEGIPAAMGRLLEHSAESLPEVAKTIQETNPRLITTVARGSSDHAATYLKYAFEIAMRVPVASIGPSVSSIYNVDLQLPDSLCLAISQSGKSPDIVSMVQSARRGGAFILALTNNPQSPLSSSSNVTIDIRAGTESSVAATKTFVNSVYAGLLLLAHWKNDADLLQALEHLPELAERAISRDWEPLARRVLRADALYILGRGPCAAIAQEVALKFKETCGIQGEAFSSAEVLHGPVSIVKERYPVLALIADDMAASSVSEVAERLAAMGGDVFSTRSDVATATSLPTVSCGHPLCDPLLQVVSFYAFVEQLARLRGLHPDQPQNLKKVTETV